MSHEEASPVARHKRSLGRAYALALAMKPTHAETVRYNIHKRLPAWISNPRLARRIRALC